MNSLYLSFAFVAILIAITWPLGAWLSKVLQPSPGNSRLSKAFDLILGSSSNTAMGWKKYFLALVAFNAAMFAITYLILSFQQHLPLNPDKLGAVNQSLVFHTACSFVTNTNLQHYSGESTFSYLSQLTLMWLQFTSAASGIAVFAALARGLAGSRDFGNFNRDVARILFLFLLPIALVWAIAYVFSGIPMTFEGSAVARTLEGASQTIARGPVAAFVAIKQLGTNGGGFFGPNSTHPLENPGIFSNILSLAAIPLIPMTCVWAFGRIIGRPRHAFVIVCVMLSFMALKLTMTVLPEMAPTAALSSLAVTDSPNLEGKELRLGATTGPLWAVFTTATSNGSVGAMHDSLNPLSSLGPLTGLWLNCTFGGVGVGLINFFLFMILAVFVAGLMVGRTPEYLGKKVESREMALAASAFIVHPLLILGGSAWFAATSFGAGTIQDPGAHGLTEIIYEFSSAAANNGSGFEGLADGTTAWNIVTGLVMLLGRFLPIVLPLAIAASLAAKPRVATSAGTLATDTPTFGLMVFGIILFLGALTFFPVALLGPILEHLSH